jgi:hypothetical protein
MRVVIIYYTYKSLKQTLIEDKEVNRVVIAVQHLYVKSLTSFNITDIASVAKGTSVSSKRGYVGVAS